MKFNGDALKSQPENIYIFPLGFSGEFGRARNFDILYIDTYI